MWGEQVEVVFQDMREWEAPEKADILVSELLGSFGDNELSPECLDGAQRFLKGNPLLYLHLVFTSCHFYSLPFLFSTLYHIIYLYYLSYFYLPCFIYVSH